MSAHATRPKLMPVSADPAIRSVARLTVCVTAVLRSKAMFGKDDLVDNLSRDLDRARGRRDALASEATTPDGSDRRNGSPPCGGEKTGGSVIAFSAEIEAIKTRIKQAASAFAPVIDGLCKAIEPAAAVVSEARELNSFLVSVATEIDSVIDPVARTGPTRGCGASRPRCTGPPGVQPMRRPSRSPRDSNDRLLRFPAWLSRDKDAEKKETAENARSTAA